MGSWPIRVVSSLILLAMLPLHAYDVPRIPQEHGQSLNGTEVDLPGSFAGRRGVLVISFSQGARDQVTDWGKLIAPDYGHSSQIAYFQVAQFAAVPRLLRSWVIKKVKASVPEKAQGHFVVLTEHEDQWKSVAGFSASDDAYVVVVDSSGAVRWKTHGAPSEAAYADLRQHLQ